MHKLLKEVSDYLPALKVGLGDFSAQLGVTYKVVVAPPATHLETVARSFSQGKVEWAGQNCGTARFGAFTGEISPAVLKELGCTWVILGHSERRHIYKEEDSLVMSRMKAALDEGLQVVLCVGELLQDRKSGRTKTLIESQLAGLKTSSFAEGFLRQTVIAYEPVWAIGTGETATPEQAEDVHAFIRGWVGEAFGASEASAIRILYGGSVKPENSGLIVAQKDVDGLLVGTASLEPAVFAGVICNGLKAARSAS